jgi:putative ABC transport system permease protein
LSFEAIYVGIFNRASRNVWRKKGRTLLVVLALGFSIAAIISVYTGIEASNDNTRDLIDGYEESLEAMGDITDAQIRQISVWPWGGVSQEAIDNLSANETIEDVVPFIIQAFELNDTGEPEAVGLRAKNPLFTIYGVSLDPQLDEKYHILPANIVEGETISQDDHDHKVIINEDEAHFNANVGEIITINEINLTVAGIYSTNVKDNTGIYMNLSEAMLILGMNESVANKLDVYAVNESVINSLVEDIPVMLYGAKAQSSREALGGKGDYLKNEQERQIAQLETDMEKIESTGNQIILISASTAGLIVLVIMIYTVRERTKEIGVLKALGFPGGNIMSQFIIEGTIIGSLGGIFGVCVAWLGAPIFSDFLLPSSKAYAVSNPGILIIIMALVLTGILGAVASIYPAWVASRKSPVEAMRNE